MFDRERGTSPMATGGRLSYGRSSPVSKPYFLRGSRALLKRIYQKDGRPWLFQKKIGWGRGGQTIGESSERRGKGISG